METRPNRIAEALAFLRACLVALLPYRSWPKRRSNGKPPLAAR